MNKLPTTEHTFVTTIHNWNCKYKVYGSIASHHKLDIVDATKGQRVRDFTSCICLHCQNASNFPWQRIQIPSIFHTSNRILMPYKVRPVKNSRVFIRMVWLESRVHSNNMSVVCKYKLERFTEFVWYHTISAIFREQACVFCYVRITETTNGLCLDSHECWLLFCQDIGSVGWYAYVHWTQRTVHRIECTLNVNCQS